jgi:hypothetical protein
MGIDAERVEAAPTPSQLLAAFLTVIPGLR